MRRGGAPQSGILELDVHGMTRAQAKAYITAGVRSAGREVYRVRVIHGYRGGNVLRELVRNELSRLPRVLRAEVGLNQGETDLVLRELY